MPINLQDKTKLYKIISIICYFTIIFIFIFVFTTKKDTLRQKMVKKIKDLKTQEQLLEKKTYYYKRKSILTDILKKNSSDVLFVIDDESAKKTFLFSSIPITSQSEVQSPQKQQLLGSITNLSKS